MGSGPEPAAQARGRPGTARRRPEGSADLPADAAPVLDDLAAVRQACFFLFFSRLPFPCSPPTPREQLLAAQPAARRVRVEVHSDDPPLSDRAQLELSRTRAGVVAAALAARGVEQARVVPAGCGNTLPLAPSDTPDGRALNRRVEVVFADEPAPRRPSSSGNATGGRRSLH